MRGFRLLALALGAALAATLLVFQLASAGTPLSFYHAKVVVIRGVALVDCGPYYGCGKHYVEFKGGLTGSKDPLACLKAHGPDACSDGVFGPGGSIRTAPDSEVALYLSIGKTDAKGRPLGDEQKGGVIVLAPNSSVRLLGDRRAPLEPGKMFEQTRGTAGYSLLKGIGGRIGGAEVLAAEEGAQTVGKTTLRRANFAGVVRRGAAEITVGAGKVDVSNTRGTRQTVRVSKGYSTTVAGTGPPRAPRLAKRLQRCSSVATLTPGQFLCPCTFASPQCALPAGSQGKPKPTGATRFDGDWHGKLDTTNPISRKPVQFPFDFAVANGEITGDIEGKIDSSGIAGITANHFGELSVACDGTLQFTPASASGDATCHYPGYTLDGPLSASKIG
jgi:hypothetical protein